MQGTCILHPAVGIQSTSVKGKLEPERTVPLTHPSGSGILRCCLKEPIYAEQGVHPYKLVAIPARDKNHQDERDGKDHLRCSEQLPPEDDRKDHEKCRDLELSRAKVGEYWVLHHMVRGADDYDDCRGPPHAELEPGEESGGNGRVDKTDEWAKREDKGQTHPITQLHRPQ